MIVLAPLGLLSNALSEDEDEEKKGDQKRQEALKAALICEKTHTWATPREGALLVPATAACSASTMAPGWE